MSTKMYFDKWNLLTFIQFKKWINEKVKYCKNVEMFEDHFVQLKFLTCCSDSLKRGQLH